jgi:hypothetical protein
VRHEHSCGGGPVAWRKKEGSTQMMMAGRDLRSVMRGGLEEGAGRMGQAKVLGVRVQQ